MTTVIVLFNLKPGVVPEQYEAWARRADLPGINALPSVRKFSVLRSNGLMNGSPAPYQYIETIELHSIEGFRGEVKSPDVQAVAAEFRQFADAPMFIVTEPL